MVVASVRRDDGRRVWVWLLLALALSAGAGGLPVISTAFAAPEARVPGLADGGVTLVLPAVLTFAAVEDLGGVVEAVEVGVRPSPVPRLRVGIYESLPGALEPAARYTLWLAAVVATRTAGVPLDELTISYHVPDRVEGDSLGALMTVGILAGLHGHLPAGDTVLTGTIQADGTVGPVTGILEKIATAATAGFRTILIPLGGRWVRAEGGAVVDAVAYGQSLGVDVREVGDVAAAYAALTGRPLPLPGPEPAAPAALLPAASEMVADLVEHWTRAVGQRLDAVAAHGFEPDPRAVGHREQAERLNGTGLAAQAYWHILEAGRLADGQRFLVASGAADALAREDTAGLGAALDAMLALLDETTSVADYFWLVMEEEGYGPEHLSDVPFFLELYGTLLEATVAADMAREAVAAASETLAEAGDAAAARDAGRHLSAAAHFYGRAEWLLKQAFDMLHLLSSVPPAGALPPPGTVGRLALLELTGAYLPLAVLDMGTLPGLARDLGVDAQAFIAFLAAMQPDYVLAKAFQRYVPAGAGDPYRQLAAAGRVLPMTTRLHNVYAALPRYGFLELQGDVARAREEDPPAGAPDGELRMAVDRRRLEHMLVWAEDSARRAIARVRALGIEPALSVMYLEMGQGLRTADATHQLQALVAYWRAEFLARVIRDLAR